MRINILHLSDIHFDIGNWNQDRVLKAFFDDVKKFLKDENRPDLVIVSGDISKAGQKAEFNNFKKHVIEPLKQVTGLTDDKFAFAPGNHDVNRDQVSAISKRAFATLNNRNSVNEVIAEFDDDLSPLKGLENYRDFIQSFGQSTNASHQSLFSTYKFEFDKLKLGIVTLNSAWTAWGGQEDYGQLLVGERQLEEAYGAIEACDIRMCVLHHPADWLKEFDRMAFNHFVYARFHFVLSGHVHDCDQFMRSKPGSRCIVLQAGCLYETREHQNLYSLISLDPSNAKCDVKSRLYQDSRRTFDVATNVAENGTVSFSMQMERGLSLSSNHVTAIDKIFESHRGSLDRSLVLGFDDPELTFRNVFIKPILSDAPEERERINSATSSKIPNLIDLDELIFDDSNYIIAGKKESGKTTLLHYIASESLSGNGAAQVRIPAYIDFMNDLQRESDMIQKALKKQFNKYRKDNFDLDAQLKAGRITLLIDSFDYKYPKKSRALSEFLKEYPGTKVILTTEGNFLDSLTESKIELPFDFERAYIHAFRRSNTRDLIKRVCSKDFTATQEETVLNRITKGLTDCRIPFTPFMISAALTVYRNERDFVPINKATLVERFIEILLEKGTVAEKSCGLDYRGKESFLCMLVERMIRGDFYQFNLNDLESLTAEYLKNTGSETVASELITYFLKRNIFSLEDSIMKFKLGCFFEYFAAKKMADSQAFYSQVVSGDGRDRFFSEIEYYIGLKRNDSFLLDTIEKTILALQAEIGLKIDLSTFEKFKANSSMFGSIERKELLEKLDAQRKDQEGRDRALDGSRKEFVEKDQVISKPRTSKDLKLDFIRNIILYGQLLKLSDLIEDTDYKKSKIKEFVGFVAETTLALALLNDQFIKFRVTNSMGVETSGQERDSSLHWVIPLLATLILSEECSSKHLKEIYLELFQDKALSLIERLLYLSLLSNYCPKEYLVYARELVNSISTDSVVVEILLIQLVMKYTSQSFSDSLSNIALELIADLKVLRMTGVTNKNEEVVRSKIKEEMKMKGNVQKLITQGAEHS